jgi:lambda repressor-like predicted transcriptional regulator
MRRITSVLLALGLLAGLGAAVAVAKAPGKTKPRAANVQLRGVLPVAAAYLDLMPAALQGELRAGKSLAQVATAKGKSVDGLESALSIALRSRVEAAKAAGKLDPARADRLLLRAPQLVERIVNATPRARHPRARGARGGLLKAAAMYLGLTNAQLVTELRSGKSLAQVATAKGKSVDVLEQALLAALKKKVDAAVAAGRLDAARAQKLLERAPAHIERLVNRSRS